MRPHGIYSWGKVHTICIQAIDRWLSIYSPTTCWHADQITYTETSVTLDSPAGREVLRYETPTKLQEQCIEQILPHKAIFTLPRNILFDLIIKSWKTKRDMIRRNRTNDLPFKRDCKHIVHESRSNMPNHKTNLLKFSYRPVQTVCLFLRSSGV